MYESSGYIKINTAYKSYIAALPKKALLYNVIKLRNDGFEGNTKNVLLFFCGKFEFFC